MTVVLVIRTTSVCLCLCRDDQLLLMIIMSVLLVLMVLVVVVVVQDWLSLNQRLCMALVQPGVYISDG